jgi:hypothetical protein
MSHSHSHISVENALIEYYKLKSKYDDKYDSKKMSIILDGTLSLSTKKERITRLGATRKCIVCGAEGGTNFTDENRILKAVCGNKSNPCGLNIDISKGKIGCVEDLIDVSYKKIEKIKENIIKYKLDLLFKYITDSQLQQKFSEAKGELEAEMIKYEKLYSTYIDVLNNPEKVRDIKTYNTEINTYVEQIKQIMKEYASTSNKEQLKTVIDIYLNHIIPVAEKLRNVTYLFNDIEYNDDTQEFKLIQNKNTIKNTEVYLERPHVIAFIK